MTRRAPLPSDAVAHQPLCRFESSSRTAHRTGLIHEAASTNRNLYRLMIRARFGRLPLSYGRREWAEAIGLASVDDEVCRDELQTVPISLRLAFHLSCPLLLLPGYQSQHRVPIPSTLSGVGGIRVDPPTCGSPASLIRPPFPHREEVAVSEAVVLRETKTSPT
ncbi:hypothetical protein LZ32DRAFT_321832 [Colletotrichum eremochloae]|nr:hypothetical protein LZ32DRAFT_321832 [Colletotrichum eremochloae]